MMPMNILLAPDKFKGTFSAGRVCELMEKGIREVLPDADITSCPVADGGDGFAGVMALQLGGEWVECQAQDAMGRNLVARYALCGETAIMEMSEASGIRQLDPGSLDPWRATTYGTGQMMRHAIEQSGAKRIVMGIGGSATNDGGCGMAAALGVVFLDQNGERLDPTPEALAHCVKIEASKRVALPEVFVACDVDNPLLGHQGAVRVYGPQKGVTEDDIDGLEEVLARVVELSGDQHLASLPGAGAAGGLGFGLLSFCNAALVPGFELVAGEIGLMKKIKASDLVITGEGKYDLQTLSGKGPAGVAAMAREAGKPVMLIAGLIEEGVSTDIFDEVYSVHDPYRTLEETVKRGEELLVAKAAELAMALGKK